jgi:hypothetical protein
MRYALATLLVLAGFAWGESRGFTLLSPADHHDPVPASVRSSPGGYRSYHFWHTGFHGGK